MFSWKNRPVLITGISGFVGSHLAKTLEKKGAIVFGISRSMERKNIIKTSILNKSSLEKIVSTKKISTIFHLAGEVLVEEGQKNPFDTFKTNILGTLNLLELTRKNHLDRVIIASSSHVYGTNKVPFKEVYPAKTSRPYDTSKAATDMIAQSYADSFNLPVLIPRFVNIYGPEDIHYTRLIPKTMKSLFTNEPIELWGGNAARDYLFVDDAVDAYVTLASTNANLIGKNRVFNIGTGKTITVRDLIDKIILLSQIKTKVKKIDALRDDEIILQYPSIAKAKRLLNWEAKIDLDEGLKRTLDWYRDYFVKK